MVILLVIVYQSYICVKQKNYKFVIDILEKNRYSKKNIDALLIKKTVLIALTSAIRSTKINCYVSKIIISYCADFENILSGKMIEKHVFKNFLMDHN